MFRRQWLVRGGLIGLTLLLGFAGMATRAQERVGRAAGQEREIRADAASLRQVSLSAAVREFTGPLNQQSVGAQIASAVDEFVRQGLDFSVGDFRPVPIVILQEDPTGKQRVRMAIGITVPQNAQVRGPLRLERVQLGRAVRAIHVGPHEELPRTYRAIEAALRRDSPNLRPGFPVALQILDDPRRFRPDQVRTVLNVPVK